MKIADPFVPEGPYPIKKPLRTIAAEMLSDVRSGVPKVIVKLARGLTLTLTLSGKVYTLTCGRKEVLPSHTELTTIANAFGLLQPVWCRRDIREWRCYRYAWEWVSIDSLTEKEVLPQ